MSTEEPRDDTSEYPKSTPSGNPEPKIKIFYNNPEDKTNATFIIRDEDHTISNPLRHVIMKDERVELCGYTIPHVSDYKVHLRIQTNKGYTAHEALLAGLDNLKKQAQSIKDAFQYQVVHNGYPEKNESN